MHIHILPSTTLCGTGGSGFEPELGRGGMGGARAEALALAAGDFAGFGGGFGAPVGGVIVEDTGDDVADAVAAGFTGDATDGLPV